MLIGSFTRSILEKMCLQGDSPILRKTCVQCYIGHSVSPSCNCAETASDCLETESGPSVQGDSWEDTLMDCSRFWVLKNHVTVMCLQVDLHAVGEALGSAVDVLNALQVSVSSLSPKVSHVCGLFGNLCT
jgi:hypothetical protein